MAVLPPSSISSVQASFVISISAKPFSKCVKASFCERFGNGSFDFHISLFHCICDAQKALMLLLVVLQRELLPIILFLLYFQEVISPNCLIFLLLYEVLYTLGNVLNWKRKIP